MKKNEKWLLAFAAVFIIIPAIVAIHCVATTRKYTNVLVVMKYYDYDHHRKPVEMIGTDQGLFECDLDLVEVCSRYDIWARGKRKVNKTHHRHPVVVRVTKR